MQQTEVGFQTYIFHLVQMESTLTKGDLHWIVRLVDIRAGLSSMNQGYKNLNRNRALTVSICKN